MVEIRSAEKLENRVPSLVSTPEVWNNGGLLAGPTIPGNFSPVLWRCLGGTGSYCMLPSLVSSMFISLARHLCTLPNTLCSCFSVREKSIIRLYRKHRDMSRDHCWSETAVIVHVTASVRPFSGQNPWYRVINTSQSSMVKWIA